MELFLYHGRYDSKAVMDSWGFDGPRLKGVTGLRYTYTNLELWFESPEAAQEAKKLTDWADGAFEKSLEITESHGMVVCHLTDENGATRAAYFGDWILE
ncbi:MAG: hypothetical protein LBE75_05265 [Burkholderiales bacterium]|jgi:hypothetical protein|nr:hypothetical protein [Burkholderiales bacterium]